MGSERDRTERAPLGRAARARRDEARAPDPVGAWRPTATHGAPVGRERFEAGLLGERFVVWGGFTLDGQFQTYLNSGAILDTAANAWLSLPADGAPAARMGHVAVGADERLFVWGGRTGMGAVASGGVLEAGAWRGLAAGVLAPAADATAVYDGRGVILWGGLGDDDAYRGAGARYDPSSDRWSRISDVNAPAPRAGHTAVWTGSEMIVWGGVGASGALGTGGAYDPATDAWRELPVRGAPTARLRHSAVWTGDAMIVWGGERPGEAPLGDGAAYVPAQGTFRPLEGRFAPSARAGHSAVWTGDSMIVWGGRGAAGPLATGGVYDPRAERWAPTRSEGAPSARHGHRAAWTGGVMVVWGGTGERAADHPTEGGLFAP